MPGSWPPRELPNLSDHNCTITSKATPSYNCIAWAAGDSSRWWEPDQFFLYYWPPGIPRVFTVDAYMQAFGTLGFRLCFDGVLEEGIQKVAIFASGPPEAERPTHAALQLPDGTWTSKLGECEDITHQTAGDVDGPCYGQVRCFLARPR